MAVQIEHPHPDHLAERLLEVDTTMGTATELVVVLMANQVLDLADQIDHDGPVHLAVRVTPTWLNLDTGRNVVEIVGCAVP